MTILCAINTADGVIRRYKPQVIAGVRRVQCVDEFVIVRPQRWGIERDIEALRKGVVKPDGTLPSGHAA